MKAHITTISNVLSPRAVLLWGLMFCFASALHAEPVLQQNLTQISGVTASQSSTYWTAAAAAIDNNTDGNFWHGSVNHTDNDINPWLQIDLGTFQKIDNIEVWNRTDDSGYRLANWYVFISETDMSQRTLPALLADIAVWKTTKIVAAPDPNVLLDTGAAVGRYVMIRIEGQQYLHVAEVKVNRELPEPAPPVSNPVPSLHWKLDEVSGLTAQDSSGSHNGSLPGPPYNGSAPVVWGSGYKQGGAYFQGYPYAYDGITASNSSNTILPNGSQPFTIEMWIKPSYLSETAIYPLAKNDGFRLGVAHTYNYYTPNEMRLRFWSTESGGNVDLLSSTELLQNAWSHVAVTYTGSVARMFINGVLVGSQTNSVINNGTESFKVGGGFASRVFYGAIDEVRVWQTALQPAKFLSRLHWKLNETSGLDAFDSSGNENHGRLPEPPYAGGVDSAPVVWGPGYQQNGAYFKGHPYGYNGITVSNATNRVIPQGNRPFTIAMWVKPYNLSNYTASLERTYPLAKNDGFRLGIVRTDSDDPPSYGETWLKFWSTTDQLLQSSIQLPHHVWSHVAVTYTGSVATIYINGANVGAMSGVVINNGPESLKIGGGFGSRVFDGTIDEVRVWDTALQPDDFYIQPVQDILHVIPQTNGCGGGAFLVPLPNFNLSPECPITYLLEAGPGQGSWFVQSQSSSEEAENPGVPVFLGGQVALVVAGTYVFTARSGCTDAVQKFRIIAYHRQSPTQDQKVNVAIGVMIATPGTEWDMRFENCPVRKAGAPGDAEGLATPIYLAERVQTGQPGTAFSLTLEARDEFGPKQVYEAYFRFTLPSGYVISVLGPSSNWVPLSPVNMGEYKYFDMGDPSTNAYGPVFSFRIDKL